MSEKKIPYKIYLDESEMPKEWYNVRADMKKKPEPLLDPETHKVMSAEQLSEVFCRELVEQELDDTTAYFPIPEEIQSFYKMYRPAPLIRAYCLEEKMQTPAKIYYKFEGNNTSGSHKLNSAIAQAYYAKKQGLRGVTTETGAGQWGTALSMACAYFDLDCNVYMVKCSYEQKPFRREVMRTYGATVTPSPSMETEVGRKILAEHPGTSGSLGCAVSEAVEAASKKDGYRYVLGSLLNQVMLHQSIIGLETKVALDKYGIKPDIIIGCAGGGSNLGGLIAPFMGEKLRGEADYRFIAVEPMSCPSLTRGRYVFDYCDTGMICPLVKMYTLGSNFIPAASHAGGLRYHGMNPTLSELYDQGLINQKFDASYQVSATFSHSVISGESREPKRVYERILEETEAYRSGKKVFGEKDFARAVRQTWGMCAQVWNSTTDIGDAFLDYELVNSELCDLPEILAAITLEDIVARLEKSYLEEYFALAVVSPTEE